ncbi:hypothetical protein DSO57_1001398 [Entomophthora muscae]|uniref:Uncharacterized protein n=1 Tax=Entomophthora muscae TaxID=34485 RepID=A0ACC2TKB6_9FUNG|nr:hypothetical protein DSO57_1001398 [Entomophthora muscae]
MLDPLTSSYFILTLQCALSLSLTIVSLVFPNWLTFKAPSPLEFHLNFGLFRYCSTLLNTCRVFPDPDKGDCDDPGFCSTWHAAQFTQIGAVAVGILTLCFLISLVFKPSYRQRTSWPLVLALLSLFTLFQISSMSCIAYLYNNSKWFYIGTNYGFAFYLSLGSWLITASASAFLIGFVVNRPVVYEAI